MNNNNENNQNNENIEIVNLEETNKPKQEEISDKVIKVAENIINTVDKTNNFDHGEIKLNKTNAILCYLGPLVLLPIINKQHKESKYMSFHINQGINILILYIIIFIFTGILTSMFKEVYMYSSYTPGWVRFINYVISSLGVFINLFGLINTATGKSKELPLIGKFKFIK